MQRLFGAVVKRFLPSFLNDVLVLPDDAFNGNTISMVQFRPTALTSLGIPVRVREGYISTLTFSVGRSFTLNVDGVYLVLEPSPDAADYVTKDRSQASKMARVNLAEMLLTRQLAEARAQGTSEGGGGWVSWLLGWLWRNAVNVSVTNVHIRYEHPGQHALSTGTTIAALRTVDAVKGIGDDNKSIQFSGVAAYWNVGGLPLQWDTPAAFVDAMKEQIIGTLDPEPEGMSYVLKPLDVKLSLQLVEAGRRPATRWIGLEASAFYAELRSRQYRQLLQLLDDWAIQRQRARYAGLGRPDAIPPRGSPGRQQALRQMWRYAGNVVVQEVKKHQSPPLTAEVLHKCGEQRRTYLHEYKRQCMDPSYVSPEVAAMDEELDSEIILHYRYQVRRELEIATRAAQHKAASAGKREQTASAESGWGFWGWIAPSLHGLDLDELDDEEEGDDDDDDGDAVEGKVASEGDEAKVDAPQMMHSVGGALLQVDESPTCTRLTFAAESGVLHLIVDDGPEDTARTLARGTITGVDIAYVSHPRNGTTVNSKLKGTTVTFCDNGGEGGTARTITIATSHTALSTAGEGVSSSDASDASRDGLSALIDALDVKMDASLGRTQTEGRNDTSLVRVEWWSPPSKSQDPPKLSVRVKPVNVLFVPDFVAQVGDFFRTSHDAQGAVGELQAAVRTQVDAARTMHAQFGALASMEQGRKKRHSGPLHVSVDCVAPNIFIPPDGSVASVNEPRRMFVLSPGRFTLDSDSASLGDKLPLFHERLLKQARQEHLDEYSLFTLGIQSAAPLPKRVFLLNTVKASLALRSGCNDNAPLIHVGAIPTTAAVLEPEGVLQLMVLVRMLTNPGRDVIHVASLHPAHVALESLAVCIDNVSASVYVKGTTKQVHAWASGAHVDAIDSQQGTEAWRVANLAPTAAPATPALHMVVRMGPERPEEERELFLPQEDLLRRGISWIWGPECDRIDGSDLSNVNLVQCWQASTMRVHVSMAATQLRLHRTSFAAIMWFLKGFSDPQAVPSPMLVTFETPELCVFMEEDTHMLSLGDVRDYRIQLRQTMFTVAMCVPIATGADPDAPRDNVDANALLMTMEALRVSASFQGGDEALMACDSRAASALNGEHVVAHVGHILVQLSEVSSAPNGTNRVARVDNTFCVREVSVVPFLELWSGLANCLSTLTPKPAGVVNMHSTVAEAKSAIPTHVIPIIIGDSHIEVGTKFLALHPPCDNRYARIRHATVLLHKGAHINLPGEKLWSRLNEFHVCPYLDRFRTLCRMNEWQACCQLTRQTGRIIGHILSTPGGGRDARERNVVPTVEAFLACDTLIMLEQLSQECVPPLLRTLSLGQKQDYNAMEETMRQTRDVEAARMSVSMQIQEAGAHAAAQADAMIPRQDVQYFTSADGRVETALRINEPGNVFRAGDRVTVEVVYRRGAPSRKDWVGLYPVSRVLSYQKQGSASNTYYKYATVEHLHQDGNAHCASAEFTLPEELGWSEFRLYSGSGNQLIGRSSRFLLGPMIDMTAMQFCAQVVVTATIPVDEVNATTIWKPCKRDEIRVYALRDQPLPKDAHIAVSAVTVTPVDPRDAGEAEGGGQANARRQYVVKASFEVNEKKTGGRFIPTGRLEFRYIASKKRNTFGQTGLTEAATMTFTAVTERAAALGTNRILGNAAVAKDLPVKMDLSVSDIVLSVKVFPTFNMFSNDAIAAYKRDPSVWWPDHVDVRLSLTKAHYLTIFDHVVDSPIDSKLSVAFGTVCVKDWISGSRRGHCFSIEGGEVPLGISYQLLRDECSSSVCSVTVATVGLNLDQVTVMALVDMWDAWRRERQVAAAARRRPVAAAAAAAADADLPSATFFSEFLLSPITIVLDWEGRGLPMSPACCELFPASGLLPRLLLVGATISLDPCMLHSVPGDELPGALQRHLSSAWLGIAYRLVESTNTVGGIIKFGAATIHLISSPAGSAAKGVATSTMNLFSQVCVDLSRVISQADIGARPGEQSGGRARVDQPETAGSGVKAAASEIVGGFGKALSRLSAPFRQSSVADGLSKVPGALLGVVNIPASFFRAGARVLQGVSNSVDDMARLRLQRLLRNVTEERARHHLNSLPLELRCPAAVEDVAASGAIVICTDEDAWVSVDADSCATDDAPNEPQSDNKGKQDA